MQPWKAAGSGIVGHDIQLYVRDFPECAPSQTVVITIIITKTELKFVHTQIPAG